MMLLLLLLLTQSHLEFGVVVAGGRHQRYYNYNDNDNDVGSRWTTARSSVMSAASSAFVFRDCGKRK